MTKSFSRERGLRELYEKDSERADELVFNRRGFIKKASLSGIYLALGMSIPFARFMPKGLIPAAFADSEESFVIKGKNGLRILNDRPVNAETPVHLLDDEVTPVSRFFVRNNGIPPTDIPNPWILEVDGEVDNPLSLSIRDLKTNFETVTKKLQLECGGNGRSKFNPPARGNQWTLGAIGNAEWTGVRFRDVLKAAKIRKNAVYTAHYGRDTHLSGNPQKTPLSRGMPIWKAMDPHTLVAYEMNGEPIHPLNGAPLRVIAPGWPGSVSQKWLRRIQVRNVVHDGAKMTGKSYRIPSYPVAPGQKVAEKDFQIIESMPVKSIITFPKNDTGINGLTTEIRGHAWAGDRRVVGVDISIDFGSSWSKTRLSLPPNPYSWQRWRRIIKFPVPGYYEIWARARDQDGKTQPFAIDWNPKGYLNNSMHRIALRIS